MIIQWALSIVNMLALWVLPMVWFCHRDIYEREPAGAYQRSDWYHDQAAWRR